jgi:hypothetical protein
VSTTTGPDLTTARQAVENLMDDTCTIYRDVEGTADDGLDPETGELLLPDPDADLVYAGRCKLAPTLPGAYSCGLPWDSPEPAIGDVVTVDSTRRDPDLVGKTLVVRDVLYSTFLVSRKLTLEIVR